MVKKQNELFQKNKTNSILERFYSKIEKEKQLEINEETF